MIPPWKRPDNLSVKAHQRLAEAANDMHHATAAGPLEVYGSPHGRGIVDRRKGVAPPIVRMVVTDPEVAPDVVLAQRTDGTTPAGSKVPIRVYFQREVDEELYAFKPIGGTDAIYDGKPVDWLEMFSIGRGEYDGMIPVTEGGQAVWAFPHAVAQPPGL